MKLLSSILGAIAGAATVKGVNKMITRGRPQGLLMRAGLYITATIVSATVTNWLEHRKRQSLVSPYNPPVDSYKPVMDITV